MSLIFATAAPGVCDLLRASIETARIADDALERMTNGEADPAFPAKLESKVAAAKQLEAAIAAADATPPPRTHALVIGVGEYPHLQNGKLSPAAMALGLGQLTCSVIAAQAIADWLLFRFANSARPLATIELLLSPGIYTPSDEAADKLGIPHGSSIPVEPATLANIQAAFNRWLARCNHDRQVDPFGDTIGDAAFFFFSGHGLEKEVSLLLPEDFGADENAPFARAIDLTTTHKRMGQCKADLQCWFLDACREAPIELLTSLDKPGVALKGDTGEPFLLRDAPLYQAAAEGRQAFGPPGESTYFVQQLIVCLNGLGADRKVAGNWRVTTQSLRSGLSAAIDRLPLVDGKRITCDSGSGQSNFTRVIHNAPDPVRALAKVFCQPIDAQPLADLYLQDSAGAKIQRDARNARPWVIEVNAGAYRAGADFDAPRPPALGEETIWHRPTLR
jgi:Caspase domain